ncbi:MAG: hypothetical protein LBV12_01285, partial [Puniceicoccales bacterium]|nr:hypothetical protein [Puniceicoccales bacterium]
MSEKKAWYSLESETLIEFFESDADRGLSEEAVQERLSAFGLNLLPEKKKTSAIIRFLKHFNDILVYVL